MSHRRGPTGHCIGVSAACFGYLLMDAFVHLYGAMSTETLSILLQLVRHGLQPRAVRASGTMHVDCSCFWHAAQESGESIL